MVHDCPICHLNFDSEEEFQEHIQEHTKNSILNKNIENKEKIITSKNLDHNFRLKFKKNFFNEERFDEIFSKKLDQIKNFDELIIRKEFVNNIKKIISKYPFVYLPTMLDEYFSGNTKNEIKIKYGMRNSLNLQHVTEKILELTGTRYNKSYPNPFELNLSISNWQEKYSNYKENGVFFEDELSRILFENVLRSFIIIIVSSYIQTGVSIEKIVQEGKTLKNYYFLFNMINENLKRKFELFFNEQYDNFIEDLVNELLDHSILRRKRGNPHLIVGKMSIDNIKEFIIHSLKFNDGSQSEKSLQNEAYIKFPSLNLLPDQKLWNSAIFELDEEGIIKIQSRTHSRNSGILFLNENYQNITQRLNSLDDEQIEFHGRTISPENFISELLELEKGDFDDKDDQVTRIAGLVLAESVKLKSPHEDISEFDFATDITNYNFRDEQKEAMKKLDFHIESNIFHCKVMLDETLDLQKLEKLKNSLPKNEQGIIITFKKIPTEVKEKLENNKKIQVIDEEGLKVWVGITSKIPARKNSIAKLHNDRLTNLDKKIVKVNLIDFQRGFASVSIFPEMKEETVLVRSLEEISLNEMYSKDLEIFSDNYLEFLKILMMLSTYSDLIEGLFDKKILESSIKHNSKFHLNFEHNSVILDLNAYYKKTILNCDCMEWAENPLYLCPHLIFALDYLTREDSFLDKPWDDELNPIKNTLEIIMRENISIILDRLEVYNDKSGMNDEMRIKDFIFGMSKIKESY